MSQLFETNFKGDGRVGSFQGDLQASGERLRLKSMSCPHLGHSMWSCQAVDWVVVCLSVCSVGDAVSGDKFCCRVASRERRVAPKKPK